MSAFFSLWIKLFFVLTPFFGLTMFLSMTEGYDAHRRRKLALSVGGATAVVSLLLFYAGEQMFTIFGITLDAFRVGAGVLLMLSAINLVHGQAGSQAAPQDGDVAVVPLAIPIIVGPATIGTLLVMGAEMDSFSAKLVGSLALLAAVASIAVVLLSGSLIKKALGNRGIVIMSKITGMILSALSAEMILTGIRNFLGL